MQLKNAIKKLKNLNLKSNPGKEEGQMTTRIALSARTYRSNNFIDDWLCLYDVTAQTFSTDLDKHNKRHATLTAE